MPTFRAAWLLPICDEPIRNGWVTVDAKGINRVGAGVAPDAAEDLGRSVILPSLVNAHTHLELSYLEGRVPPGTSFVPWVRSLMALRRTYPDPSAPEILASARKAIAAARAAGTGLIGDVSNTLVTVPMLREAAMPSQVFHELLGFSVAEPGARVAAAAAANRAAGEDQRDVRVTLAAHAPYSVSPDLFRAIRAAVDERPSPVTTVHLGESPDEVQFLRNGTGPFRTLLEDFGVWAPDWQAPGTAPVNYLLDLGFLDCCVLAVHGVQFDGDDLSPRGARRHHRVVSAEQRARRRRVAAARSLLRDGREGRVRHRQPGQRRRPESVHGAEGSSPHRAAGAGPAAARERDADGCARARVRRAVRKHRAWQAGVIDSGPRAGRRRRCGRIPGRRNRA